MEDSGRDQRVEQGGDSRSWFEGNDRDRESTGSKKSVGQQAGLPLGATEVEGAEDNNGAPESSAESGWIQTAHDSVPRRHCFMKGFSEIGSRYDRPPRNGVALRRAAESSTAGVKSEKWFI